MYCFNHKDISAIGLCVGLPVHAFEILSELKNLEETSQQIKEAKASVEQARQRGKASYEGWHPSFALTSGYGYENQIKGVLPPYN